MGLRGIFLPLIQTGGDTTLRLKNAVSPVMQGERESCSYETPE
nr:MAG TPA: hypothetical protein [Caudoviricetes sp.]